MRALALVVRSFASRDGAGVTACTATIARFVALDVTSPKYHPQAKAHATFNNPSWLDQESFEARDAPQCRQTSSIAVVKIMRVPDVRESMSLPDHWKTAHSLTMLQVSWQVLEVPGVNESMSEYLHRLMLRSNHQRHCQAELFQDHGREACLSLFLSSSFRHAPSCRPVVWSAHGHRPSEKAESYSRSLSESMVAFGV